jgi:hypothetical protein
MLYLPKQNVSSGAHTLIAKATNSAGTTQKALTDVLIGDVWVCGGQSNMEGTVDYETGFNKSSVNNLPIRIFKLKIWYSDEKWDSSKISYTQPDVGPQDNRGAAHSWLKIPPPNNEFDKASLAVIVLAREITKVTGCAGRADSECHGGNLCGGLDSLGVLRFSPGEADSGQLLSASSPMGIC